MSEEYGDSFITMVDEDGKEFVLELLESIDFKGATYTAFLPADMDENDPDYGLVLLRNAVDENGEEVFDTIEDDDELNEVYEQFMRILFDDEEESEE
ncbi:MAG: DUF1292 domain-containing protein [Oscillospiraceae bacterium]|nr:DUF1292 domain-containing protein [Oscillospiraceae bacterium]